MPLPLFGLRELESSRPDIVLALGFASLRSAQSTGAWVLVGWPFPSGSEIHFVPQLTFFPTADRTFRSGLPEFDEFDPHEADLQEFLRSEAV